MTVMVRSLDLDEIKKTIAPYVNKCARVYVGIRANFPMPWYPFDRIEGIEDSIYELLESAYNGLQSELQSNDTLTHLHTTTETTGISIRLEQYLVENGYTLDPMADYAYSTVDIKFTIVPCQFNMFYFEDEYDS